MATEHDIAKLFKYLRAARVHKPPHIDDGDIRDVYLDALRNIRSMWWLKSAGHGFRIQMVESFGQLLRICSIWLWPLNLRSDPKSGRFPVDAKDVGKCSMRRDHS